MNEGSISIHIKLKILFRSENREFIADVTTETVKKGFFRWVICVYCWEFTVSLFKSS